MCALTQRADAAAAASPGAGGEEGDGGRLAPPAAPVGVPAPRVLRTYGQRRPKADARSEAAPLVAPDVLALIAGRGLGA